MLVKGNSSTEQGVNARNQGVRRTTVSVSSWGFLAHNSAGAQDARIIMKVDLSVAAHQLIIKRF